MKHLVLKIGGMTCMNCVKAIENVLADMDGVSGIEVDLSSGRLELDYQVGITGPEEIAESIEDGGYDVLDS